MIIKTTASNIKHIKEINLTKPNKKKYGHFAASKIKENKNKILIMKI